MNSEDRLNDVADRYRSQGFRVIVRPGPDDLPPFAKDFKVEIVGTSDTGNVLASAKASPSELEADPNVARYAEITEKQPGWRFDVLVLGPDQPPVEKVVPREPDEEEIIKELEAANRVMRMDAGLGNLAFVSAWASLEAAMRRRLRAEGEEAGWGSSPRTMLNQLYSSGAISTGELRELEGMSTLRNALVHGFATTTGVDDSVVMRLVQIARQLLEDARPAKQTA